jgi:amidohydrolase
MMSESKIDNMNKKILSGAELNSKIISLRRHFHMYPEMSNYEKNTSKKIIEELKCLGFEIKENIGGYGVSALLKGSLPGKTVAIRADMDALPLIEQNNVDYKSKISGVMHACGHDAHMAVVLGAAHLLAGNREKLKGNVKFLFQPAEEKPPGGALGMIKAGVLKDPFVDAIFGVHNSTDIPVGQIMVSEGTIMAGSDYFSIIIKGPGGHGAMPEKTNDTVLIASHFIIILQNVINRKFNQNDQPVISIGKIEGGTTHNIIPREVILTGTVRYFYSDDERIVREIESILESVTKIFGGEFEFTYSHGYPVTINDVKLAKLVRETAMEVEGVREVGEFENKAYVAEDFGYFSREIPACYFVFGGRNPDKGFISPPHTAEFDLDDEFLPVVSRVLKESVIKFLQ